MNRRLPTAVLLGLCCRVAAASDQAAQARVAADLFAFAEAVVPR
jgi:hypothetical protein